MGNSIEEKWGGGIQKKTKNKEGKHYREKKGEHTKMGARGENTHYWDEVSNSLRKSFLGGG